MPIEHTLVLMKPDAVQRGLIGEVIGRFERKGLTIEGLKMMRADRELAVAHYAPHAGKTFYEPLLAFITADPVVAMAVRGDGAVHAIRNMVGATDGRVAHPGTIRGDFGISPRYNLVHASDSPESAARELALWFPDGFVAWQRCDRQLLEMG